MACSGKDGGLPEIDSVKTIKRQSWVGSAAGNKALRNNVEMLHFEENEIVLIGHDGKGLKLGIDEPKRRLPFVPNKYIRKKADSNAVENKWTIGKTGLREMNLRDKDQLLARLNTCKPQQNKKYQ